MVPIDRAGQLEDQLRDLQVGHHIAERACACGAEHGAGHAPQGFPDNGEEFLDPNTSVNENSHDQAVHRSDHAAFRCGEDPAQHTGDDDHRDQES